MTIIATTIGILWIAFWTRHVLTHWTAIHSEDSQNES
jgi:hypothetical protein